MPAVFESHDPTYQGLERRDCERRLNHDRRLSIRLNTTETERRHVAGRRKQDHDIWPDYRPE